MKSDDDRGYNEKNSLLIKSGIGLGFFMHGRHFKAD